MVDVNSNPFHHQPQYNAAGQFTENIMIDSRLLQAQSQMEAINAAAAAVAAHRQVGTVQFIDGH